MKKPWLVIIVLLLGILAWRWYFPPQAPVIAVNTVQGQGGDEIKTLLDSMDRVSGFPAKEAYQLVSDRPLFFSKRRPPPPYVPTPPGKKPPIKPPRKIGKPRMQLSAIIVVGEQKYALVKGGRQKGSRRVRVGEEVDGWKVTRIETDRLVLSNGGETEELLLRNYRPVVPVKSMPKPPAVKKNNNAGKAAPKPATPKP
ncbi:hypothetical protein [Thiolapillus sp.]